MKKILLSLLMLTCSIATWADGQYLKVWQTDGTVISINLDDEPSATYTEGNLVIATTKNSIQIPLANVRKYTYVFGADGIKPVDIQNVRFTDDGNTLIISGLKAKSSISLFTVDGKLLYSEQSNDRSEVTVSMTGKPAGMYAVKINDITYKLLKR